MATEDEALSALREAFTSSFETSSGSMSCQLKGQTKH